MMRLMADKHPKEMIDTMTHEAVKQANEVREGIEKDVEFGSARSEPFSPEVKVALAELRQTMANC